MHEDPSSGRWRPPRWAWSTGVSALALFTVGCSRSAPPPSTPSPPPHGQAVLTGGIIPCAGIPVRNGPRYSAGLVDVLKGQVTWRTTAPGNQQAVFPESVVTEQRVSTNGSYRFVLGPGRYVLQAHFPAPVNVTPFTEVVLATGTVVTVDIPNMCL